MSTKQLFVVDANTIISASKLYYHKQIAMPFWDFIKEKITVGEIVILNVVADEIRNGDDWESDWVKSIPKGCFIKSESPKIVQRYAEVLEFIRTSPFFNENALRAWSEKRVADPWLIAYCLANNHTLVTLEKSTARLDEKSPVSKIKIPQVCDLMGVKYMDTFAMLKNFKFCFKTY